MAMAGLATSCIGSDPPMLIFISMQPLSCEPIICGAIEKDCDPLSDEVFSPPAGVDPAQSFPEHCSSEEGAPPFDVAEDPSPTPTAALAEQRTLATQVARKSSRAMDAVLYGNASLNDLSTDHRETN